jgi:DNA processing protein
MHLKAPIREKTMDDLKYWLALSRISGLGPKKFEALLQSFDSMEDAWIAGKRDLTAAGLDARTAGRIAEERAEIYPDTELERLESAGVTAIPRTSADYPAGLKEIYDPPAVIFIRGEFAEADKRSIAVVGTRRPTPYGREACRRLSEDLARNCVTVISGLARGIDGVAHEAALDAGGRTIAVLGSGLDRIYPGEHVQLARRIAENGVVVSEFPLGSRPDARNFPRRNRILSALTLGTMVIEAPMKSGAMLTVEHAVQQNRDVFAVPGTIFSEPSKGTNWLIQQGAKLVSNARDVLDELNIVVLEDQLPLTEPQVDDETERRILSTLGEEPLHIDDVTRTTGLTSPVVASTLSLMELKGLVRQAGSMQYVQARMSHTPNLTRSG